MQLWIISALDGRRLDAVHFPASYTEREVRNAVYWGDTQHYPFEGYFCRFLLERGG